MPWNLRAQVIESCSCNMLCPCWFGVKDLMVMDRGWCDGAMVFRILNGKSDGVALNGRIVVLAVDFQDQLCLMATARPASTLIVQQLRTSGRNSKGYFRERRVDRWKLSEGLSAGGSLHRQQKSIFKNKTTRHYKGQRP